MICKIVLRTFVLLHLSIQASASVKERLWSHIDDSIFKKEDFAILVQSGDKELFKYQEKKKMIPASLTKIFTAATVLENFHPNHKFMTELWINGKVKSGVLKGHLYLKGGGDPSFVSENMWFLVNKFKRTGIRKIEGDIIVDDSLFDDDRYPGRKGKRNDRAYDAPVDAMSFNWNSVNVYLRTDLENKRELKVSIDPENDYISLINKAKVGYKNAIRVSRVTGKKGDVIHVGGTLHHASPEKAVYKSITRPSIWAGYNLRSFLKQRSIEVSGKVRRGQVSPNATMVADSESKPISLIVADLMKFSNNYVAEMLTKHLSLTESDVGNLDEGLSKIRRFVKSFGYLDKDFNIENASGLTPKNLFTATQTVQALNYMRKRFDLAPEFMTSLPIAGIDGTLKDRMNKSSAEKWVRAKTGLLSGAVGLAGFAGRDDGEVWTFAFIFNGKSGREADVRALFDKMTIELVK